MTNTENLRKIITEAAEIAALVPENMQGEAFNRAFEALRGTSLSSKTPPTGNAVDPPMDKSASVPLAGNDDWWQQLQSSKYPDVFDARNATLRFMRILQIARDDFNVEYVTPQLISQLLLKKFKISVTPATVSARLGGVVRLLDRQEEGSGYKYALMHPGDKYLQENANKFAADQTPTIATTSVKRTGGTKKKTTVKPATKQKAARSGSRPGQKAMLEALITEGFFDQPKTIADIIKHISKNQGYNYKATDLSTPLVRLVRDKKLTRDENSDGQYEYVAK